MFSNNVPNITFDIFVGNAFIGIKEKNIGRGDANFVSVSELEQYADNIYDLMQDKIAIENFHHGMRKLPERYPELFEIVNSDDRNGVRLLDGVSVGKLASQFQVSLPLNLSMTLQHDDALSAFMEN